MSDRLAQINAELERLYSKPKQQVGNCVEQSLEELVEAAEIREKIARLEREQAELIGSGK